jgi:hypothetical protein
VAVWDDSFVGKCIECEIISEVEYARIARKRFEEYVQDKLVAHIQILGAGCGEGAT